MRYRSSASRSRRGETGNFGERRDLQGLSVFVQFEVVGLQSGQRLALLIEHARGNENRFAGGAEDSPGLRQRAWYRQRGQSVESRPAVLFTGELGYVISSQSSIHSNFCA